MECRRPFIGPARIRRRELHVNASADGGEQYAIAAKPAQSVALAMNSFGSAP